MRVKLEEWEGAFWGIKLKVSVSVRVRFLEVGRDEW